MALQLPATILTVDDDPDTSLAIAELLQVEGYHVETVRTGVEAIARIKRDGFHAVLLDVGLPDRDGLSVMEEMLGYDPQLPVILLTAHHHLKQTVGSLDLLGAFAYLRKPYNGEELISTIRRAVQVKLLSSRADRVQQALCASEDRFQSVAQSTSDAIVVANDEGHIVSWNSAAETMFGYTHEEIIGKPLTTIMPSSYRAKHLQGLERVRNTGQTRVTGKTLELEGLRKNGEEFPLELSLGVWMTATGRYCCGIIRDITVRKHEQTIFQEREARLRHLVNHSQEVMVLLDVEGDGVLDVNARACERLGFSREAFLEMSLSSLFPLGVSELKRLITCGSNTEERVSAPLSCLTQSGRLLPVVLRTRRVQIADRPCLSVLIRDQESPASPESATDAIFRTLSQIPLPLLTVNKTRHVSFANHPACCVFEAPEGPLVGRTIVDVLPISEQRWDTLIAGLDAMADGQSGQTPECVIEHGGTVLRCCIFPVSAQNEFSNHIGLVLCDMTHERELQDQLIHQEKLSTLGLMVSGMAHEISNPLQAVLGLSELLEDEHDPQVMRQWARDLARVSRQAITTLKNFTAYARPSARDQLREIDVNERLQEATAMVKHSPHFGQVVCVPQLHPVPRLLARQSEVDQVFINLMSNAVQAMEGRGQLMVSTCADHATVTIQISDTGPGIPAERLRHVWDPFYTTKTSGKGTGLGLHIVKEIVTKYGGKVQVESTMGEGATFILQFPVGEC